MNIDQAILSLDLKREPQGLYEPIEYTLAAGGKRLRPMLVLLANSLFGGQEEKAMPAALAIEIFHNFTLLHDDVMDKAPVRRGRPTVHTKWNENTAILSGDQMLIEAYKQLSLLPADKLPLVLNMFNKMGTEICEGQQYDVDFETKEDVLIDDYLMMIRLKTSVLLATALQIGGYLAGATEQQQHSLYEFGINIGLAFQIQDDILDVYGDPTTFGKKIGGDILCNKKTYMLLTALKLADNHTLEQLITQFTNPNEQLKIQTVTSIYNQLNVRQIAEQTMMQYTQAALDKLSLLPDNSANEQLRSLANKLLTRII